MSDFRQILHITIRVALLGVAAIAMAAAGTVTYVYDELGRLRTVSHNGQAAQYDLDAAGNRISVTSTGSGPPGAVSFTGTSASCVGSLCYALSAYLSWTAASGSVTRYEAEKTSDGLSYWNIYSGTNLYAGSYLYEVEVAGFRVRACNPAGCGPYTTPSAWYFRPYGW